LREIPEEPFLPAEGFCEGAHPQGMISGLWGNKKGAQLLRKIALSLVDYSVFGYYGMSELVTLTDISDLTMPREIAIQKLEDDEFTHITGFSIIGDYGYIFYYSFHYYGSSEVSVRIFDLSQPSDPQFIRSV
jgi:hypothetical protein